MSLPDEAFGPSPVDTQALETARWMWDRTHESSTFDSLPRRQRFALWQVLKRDIVGDAPLSITFGEIASIPSPTTP
jgi:hypothetical protein